ncbi:D-TA family PLP-dependent enzyme [Lunatimonas salinarum]|uniref:D-TA family PLP-dependent enzyme n=1 Tax=Lunatimonas salinarum TaxID=1774590 RepID=UPI001ADF5733|nr:D-TA family PLP-dependent enzyme [Lunatimonas salinarum]
MFDQSKYGLSEPDLIDSPALLIFTDIVKENIQKAVQAIGDVQRLRPHVKTNKSIEACRLMMDAGISRFKCATIPEAEMLVKAGAKDILLSYQPVGPKQVRWEMLIQDFPAIRFACLVDTVHIANQLSEKGVACGKPFEVYLDINAQTNRTGIVPDESAEELYRTCLALPGLKVAGMHVYDGHLRQLDWNERKIACDAGFSPVADLAAKMRSEGVEVEIVAGGSTTFTIHAKRSGVVCSPGTFIYWDKGYSDGLPEQPYTPAALVFTRIISLPAPDLICLDLGHKSIAAENPLANRVTLLGVSGWEPVSQSEEHLVYRVSPDHTHQVGDGFFGIPYHICPTVALYEQAYTVKDGRPTGVWRTISRDKKITY